ncbi:Endonuclease/exonuclease/phosphatase [Pisolithus orientalis]|uniref:Endonuclease/exonuclease/phosphatase n=1 Tax=Pisolithus orientalis TaxID=936130 RepID=UPI002225B528|nr:Endonuclease/exonuclease/phosphatase [Pisolithus orientalis]KAI6010944.1 Endonuclease/exonuclease/phosphatase [Pisolithus orientalis]
MRILSWNINGVRTLPQYHPWNTFKTFREILTHLQADIVCFQEMKTARNGLDRNIAVPDPFDGYFSFPANKGGYSGVAIYTDSRTVAPLKAEEGLSGTVQPKPPLSEDERISRHYPCANEMNLIPDEHGNKPSELTSLDTEGRALILDLGLFVLINVYCPNETSDSRLPFKMNYHLMLQERVGKLINEGRDVIVVGDINICATPLDHCDGHLASNAATFYDHPARAWFRDWLSPNGCMTDAVRTLWPCRKGMYTCWNTKICARETNYGTRVDYILVTRGILPWIKHAEGKTAAVPRLAARCWDEFSGKQTLLSAFFSKGDRVSTAASASDSSSSPSGSPSASQASVISSSTASNAPDAVLPDRTESLDLANPLLIHDAGPTGAIKTGVEEQERIPSKPPTGPPKRKLTDVPAARTKPNKKLRPAGGSSAAGKGTLDAFFATPQPSRPSQSQSRPSPPQSQSQANGDPLASDCDPHSPNSDYQLALRLSLCLDEDVLCAPGPSQTVDSQTPSTLSKSAIEPSQCRSSSGSKAAWSKLMAPIEPPKCNVHGEPAKLYTVNKPGPNKGKTFYICSRPVGPGYDKGRGERPRDEVDHRYRCNFFKWASEVRRESASSSSSSLPSASSSQK